MHRQVNETNLSSVKTCIDDYDWNIFEKYSFCVGVA